MNTILSSVALVPGSDHQHTTYCQLLLPSLDYELLEGKHHAMCITEPPTSRLVANTKKGLDKQLTDTEQMS